MMKARRLPAVTAVCVLVLCFLWVRAEAAAPPAVGGILPDIVLDVPKDSGERSYLGLSWWNKTFTIPAIKARVVIVEIFSMYCPYCQAEAPKVNALYEKIEADPALKEKMKLIGIGVGNSSYEVGVFKKRYQIPFPLFPDGGFAIHKQVGEVRTPYFIGVRIEGDGSHRVFFSRLGAFDTADGFLKDMVRLSGLK
jgi:thiol-disulfide isomerase/thioredoxin